MKITLKEKALSLEIKNLKTQFANLMARFERAEVRNILMRRAIQLGEFEGSPLRRGTDFTEGDKETPFTKAELVFLTHEMEGKSTKELAELHQKWIGGIDG